MRRIRKDRVGASHAVYFADLTDGERCVLRVVVHADEDIGLEVWMAERCRERGVPTPQVMAYEAQPSDGWPAFVVTRRVPGTPGEGVFMPLEDRRAVLRQLGTYLAAIHSIPVTGFGQLIRSNDTYAGREGRLWTRIDHEVRGELAQLSDDVLPPSRKEQLYARFAAERETLDRSEAVACHGDYRLKNAVLAREHDTWRVSAVLDFEMAHAGDPACDLAYFFYSLRSKPWRDADLAAICEGYGVPYPLPRDVGRRVTLYQLYAALSHLWWEISLDENREIERVLGWIAAFEAALDD